MELDEQPTDQEPKITGHPFRPHPLHPEVCGYQRPDGWACGHSAAEHEEVVPSERPGV